MAKDKERSTVGQKIVNIVGILLCIVFVPLIIINLILIVKSYTSSERIPTVFGVAPVICLSGSMEPEFSVGDMIFIKEVNTETLEDGDVICFIPFGAETAVTHRIVETQVNAGQKVFITRGDANNTEDRMPVTSIEIQGKYTGVHIPKLGDVSMFMQTTTGMIVFIVVPLLVFVLWDVLRRALASRKNSGRAEELEEELERLRAQVGQAAMQNDGYAQAENYDTIAQDQLEQQTSGFAEESESQQDTAVNDSHTQAEDAEKNEHQEAE